MGSKNLYHVIAYPRLKMLPACLRRSGLRERWTIMRSRFTLASMHGRQRADWCSLQRRDAGDAMIARFYDRTAGAFYDAALPEGGAAPLGALSARRNRCRTVRRRR